MSDDKIIDLTKFYHQQKIQVADGRNEKFYKALEQVDYETFKTAVVCLLKSFDLSFREIEGGFNNVNTQFGVASDNFHTLEKCIEDLDWCVDKLADHVI